MQIPFDIFNAAYLCTRKKNGAAAQLQTIHISEEGRLVGTDGHVLYVSNQLVGLRPRNIVIWEKPKVCLLVELTETEAIGRMGDGSEKWRIPITENVNPFPDYQRILWDDEPTGENFSIGLGIPVLRKISEVFKSESQVKYTGKDALSSFRIEGKHGTVWAMPCRL